MNEFKGTKGQWKVDKSYNRALEKYGMAVRGDYENNLGGETVVFIGTSKKDVFPEYQKANALLISKAPEMLEMLKRIVYNLENEECPFDEDEIKALINSATEL